MVASLTSVVVFDRVDCRWKSTLATFQPFQTCGSELGRLDRAINKAHPPPSLASSYAYATLEIDCWRKTGAELVNNNQWRETQSEKNREISNGRARDDEKKENPFGLESFDIWINAPPDSAHPARPIRIIITTTRAYTILLLLPCLWNSSKEVASERVCVDLTQTRRRECFTSQTKHGTGQGGKKKKKSEYCLFIDWTQSDKVEMLTSNKWNEFQWD